MRIPRAVAVVIDGQLVLVIKRFLRRATSAECPMCEDAGHTGPRCRGHDYAVLPGGHVEAGESPETAALRELREETTLTARIERLLWTGTHNSRPASYFLMTDVAGTPVLAGEEAEENSADNSFEVIWAGPEDFDALRLHPADIRRPLTQLLASSGRRTYVG